MATIKLYKKVTINLKNIAEVVVKNDVIVIYRKKGSLVVFARNKETIKELFNKGIL